MSFFYFAPDSAETSTMFKQITAALLLLCFMTQVLSRAAVVGSYYMNTEAYAKNCINKAKPKLHCNGKCQMMKKLRQEEKKDAQNPERRSNMKDEVLSSKSHFASVQLIIPSLAVHHFDHSLSYTNDRAIDIFHPPGA